MKPVELNDILREQGINLEHVLVLRHTPKERKLRKELPRLAMERPDLYNAYQQTQTRRVEKMMKEAEYVASFIGHESDKAVFVGLYKRGKSHPLTKTAFCKVPENRQLCEFGARGWSEDEDRHFVLWFALELQDTFAQWKGKLVIKWPGRAINWSRWAKGNTFPIYAILEKNILNEEKVTSSSGGRARKRNDTATIPTPEASDLPEPPERLETTTYRILRDTALARRVKVLHDFKCQICGHSIKLADGVRYAEAHHIKPLGGEHKGPDVLGNILCVCPNHHAELDLGASPIRISILRCSKRHAVDPRYIDYHNTHICNSKDE